MTAQRTTQEHGVFRITPVSPVHIGSGEILTPMDYEIRKNQFMVKDIMGFIDAQRDDPAYALQIIEDCKPIPEEFTRYTLACYNEGEARNSQRNAQPRNQPQRGKPAKMDKQTAALFKKVKKANIPKPIPAPSHDFRDREPGGEVREFIKDPFGKPYIPGSSLKGCLRTALAYTLVKCGALNMKLVDALLDDKAKPQWAFSKMNADLFCGDERGDAKADVLKTLMIRDSQPLDFNQWGAMVFVRVMNDYSGKFDVKRGMPIRLEAIMPRTDTVDMPFVINRRLMELDKENLQRAGKGKTLALLQDVNAFEQALMNFSKALLAYEADFYGKYKQDAATGSNFIQQLQQEQQKNNTLFLDLGFSTGWHSKTIGMALDDRDLEDIRNHFRLGKNGVPLFPKTRKWAKTDKGYLPLGWVKLEIIREN